jgi:hypothetical protein
MAEKYGVSSYSGEIAFSRSTNCSEAYDKEMREIALLILWELNYLRISWIDGPFKFWHGEKGDALERDKADGGRLNRLREFFGGEQDK